MYSLQRDNSWLDDPDIAYRLYRGRALLRDAVRAVYADRCIVDWSSPRAPFHGVMMRAVPTRILVNPMPVIQHRGDRTDALALTLLGVALHEASHAIHTSARWPTVLRQRRRRLEGATGYILPGNLIGICANLAEDVWIEDRLADTFPGYVVYFEVMRQYLFTDAKCAQQVEQLTLLWSAYSTTPAAFTERNTLTALCVNVVISLVNRPDCAALQLPAGLEDLNKAAQTIRAAGKERRISIRLDGAAEAADRIYNLLRQWMGQTTGNDGSEEKAGASQQSRSAVSETSPEASDTERATAVAVERAIEQPDVLLRMDGNPRGRARVPEAKSAQVAVVLREMEAMERREQMAEETLAVRNVVAPTVLLDEGGRTLCREKTVRVVDSAPETLYAAEGWPLDSLAAGLFAAHREQAERFRRDFTRLLQSESPSTVHGLTQGTPDEDALADLATGSLEVFQQTHVETTIRLDLTLLIDESGSMSSMGTQDRRQRWEMASATAILLEYALRPHFGNKQVRLRVYGYTSDCFADGETVLYRHFDSAISRLNRPQSLGWCYPKYANTDGIALAGIRREILKTRLPGQELALLMISDGQPSGIDYEGSAAHKHVRLEVEETVRCGIGFAHLQIGPTSDKILQTMYGSRWQRVERGGELADHVAKLVGIWICR